MNTPARKEQGSIAVEMAIVLPLMVMLITGLIWFAQVFLYYSVMQKAAYDAARLLSVATPVEISTLGAGSTVAPVAHLVSSIIEQQTAALRHAEDGILIDVQCDFSSCGIAVPSTVRVAIRARMPFPVLEQSTVMLTADVTMRYAGN